MIDKIENQQLKDAIVKIINNDIDKEQIQFKLEFIKLLDNADKSELDSLLEVLLERQVIEYICINIKSMNIESFRHYEVFSKLIKELVNKEEDKNLKLCLFEIYAKLKFGDAIRFANEYKDEEIKELFFEVIFLLINKDKSLRYLNRFIFQLKSKYNEFDNGTLFDFIDLLNNIIVDNLNFDIYYKLINILENKDKDLMKNLIKIKNKNYRLSKEYKIIEDILLDKEVNLELIDITILALSINSKSTRDIMKIMDYLLGTDIFDSLIDYFINENVNEINKSNLIKIIKSKVYYRNEEQEYIINKFIEENHIILDEFEKEFNVQSYINKKVRLIYSYINKKNIRELENALTNINDIEVSREISIQILELMIQNKNIDMIVYLWEQLNLSIPLRLEYSLKVKKLILSEELIKNEYLNFLIDLDLDDVNLYINIKSSEDKKKLLDIWSNKNKNGKISDVLKYIIDKDADTIDKLDEVRNIAKYYHINDRRLDSYIKLKIYSKLEFDLLDIDYMNEGDLEELDDILNKVVEYGLENRLLNDKYILDMVDKEVKETIAKRIINKSQNIEVLEAFWEIIDDGIRKNQRRDVISNLNIILPYITKSNEKIEWFLDLLQNKKYNHDVIEYIIEICLENMSKSKKIINQLNRDIETYKPKILLEIGKNIVNAISSLEKSVLNISDENQMNIIVNNVKSLRKSLSYIGISTVEDISNYNKVIEVNEDIHILKGSKLSEFGIVETLGIKIGKDIIAKSIVSELKGEYAIE